MRHAVRGALSSRNRREIYRPRIGSGRSNLPCAYARAWRSRGSVVVGDAELFSKHVQDSRDGRTPNSVSTRAQSSAGVMSGVVRTIAAMA